MRYFKKCPKCRKTQNYASKHGFDIAKKRNLVCGSCAQKETQNRPDVRNKVSKRTSEAMKLKLTDPKYRAKHLKACPRRKNHYNWRPRGKEYTRWQEYKLDVWRITKQQPLYLLENFDKRGRFLYHLDHKIPICVGFMRGIPANVIGNIKNLQMLWWRDNLHKSKKSVITEK